MNVTEIIQAALREDIGDGDHSALACIPETEHGEAKLLVKEKGVLAGVEIALAVFKEVDPKLLVSVIKKDGELICIGDIVLTVKGKSQSILKAERLVLNIMQRMSGIATKTASMVDLVKDTNVKLLDTRKTTPNFRVLEKMAVKIGGAENHRMGLYDMIMLKDNHIDYAGGIKQAISKTKQYLDQHKKNLKIEVEARDLDEVKQILEAGPVDRIMLDNFSFADIKTAVTLIGNRSETEASGGITEDTLLEYALCGVNYISIGALTHAVKSLDLSLKAV
ncbi:MAG: nicotinate-nucleotide pyrophosphorylase (carboxylating) [Flavobacteriales bacterium]|jgi:nicotinate-nucleotide pyrophosphorylase (carboxylating)